VLKTKVKNTNLLTISVLILIFSLASSCGVKKGAIQIDDGSLNTILKKIELFEGAVRSLKGLAKVKIKTPDSKISYTQVTIAERPDLLRLEALNPFGKTVGFISSDGTNIYIISPSERGVYDSSTNFDLAYVYPGLNLKITATNLVNLILGRLPDKVYDLGSKPEMSADGSQIKLNFASDNSSEPNTLWVNSTNYRVEKAEFSVDQESRAVITYEYFDSLIDGFYFPKTIDFASKGLSITIVYDPDVELNKNVDKALYRPAAETAKFGN
jgi:outer membrane lipoprotein-sorting protein